MLIVYSSQIALFAIIVILLCAAIAALSYRASSKDSFAAVTLSDEERSLLLAMSDMKRRQKSEARSAASPAGREKVRRRAERDSRKQVGQSHSLSSDVGASG